MSDNETYDWSAHYDAEGNLYYHNSVTDETTWDAPEKFNPPEKDDDNNNKEKGGEDGAWEKHTDDEGNVYYYNTATEVTTWDKPEGFQDDDNEEPAVKEEGEETAPPSSPVAAEDSALPSSPVGDDKDEDGDVKMEDAPKKEESDADATGAWERHEDDDGKEYFFNTITEETSWDRPEGFQEELTAKAKEESSDKGKWEKLTDDDGKEYYFNAVTEVTQWDKPDDFEEEEPTDVKIEEEEEGEVVPTKKKGDWKKVTDDDGQEYYYNSVTEETTWDKPDDYEEDGEATTAVKKEEKETDASQKKKKSDWEMVTDDDGREYYYNAVTEETAWDKPDDYEEEEKEGTTTPVKKEEEESAAETSQEKSKSDWEKHTNDDGREYYYNPVTEATTWEKPDDYVEGDAAAPSSPKPDVAADTAAKEGQWEKLTDEEGRTYYYNATTETTQWEEPDDYVEGAAAASPKPETSSSKAAAGGWEKYTDDDGRIYYYNATSGETQWEAPEGFVEEDEKKSEADDEFQPSPVRAPSPSEMSVEEPEPEPEPESEPEIDPAVKRLMDAEEALKKPDSVMEPDCAANVLEVVSSEGGQKKVMSIVENYQGTTAVSGILAKWLADLRASSKKVKDVNAIVGTATHSVADGIRNTVQDVVNLIAKERYTTSHGDDILKLSKSEAAFLVEMIKSSRWRKLLIDLAAKHKGDALLMFCIRTISKQGFHRELVKRMNPSEYFTVFNAMLQSEVSVVGKTAISASSDVDTSIGLEELVNDLRRTCTATAYTYLYSIEVLRHLVAKAEEDEVGAHGTKRTRFRRAIRKWERLSEDLDFAMVDPSTSASTAGNSVLGRKRRLDVALTISELHQRQRRRLKPSADSDVIVVSDDQQKKSIETGLLNFLRRYSVGTQVDDRVLDALLPTGLNMQAASVEVGELLITYPLAIRALLSHMFKTGGTTRVPPSTKSKCARLVALAVLASEKKARGEIGESQDPDEDSPDEVALTRMLTQASELCEDLALTASFVVTSTGKERGALVSPGQTLCNLALKCASVAQGVMIWADDCIKQNDFTSSATYPTFSPSILTIVRIIALRHPCTRLEAADVAFTFLRHSTSGEMSYKKINEIKEQCIRLLLFLVIRGEAPAILQTLTTQLLSSGEVLKMDSSLLRYLVTGMLDIVKPPISLVFVRLFGAVLKTPRCIDALLSVYFTPVYKDKLKKMLLHFHKACSPDIGTATPADVKLVGHLIRTYSVKNR